MKYFPLLLILLALGCSRAPIESTSSNALDSLRIDLDSMIVNGDLPGFAVSIFTTDSLYFQEGFGLMDVEKSRPYSSESVQCIASVSKTFIGVSLIMATERGLINLDDPIGDYIPFAVANPNFPNKPITLRMLANHTASIFDGVVYDRSYVFDEDVSLDLFPEAWHEYVKTYKSNVPMELGEFLENESGNLQYLESEPGASYEYSNIGSSLLALAIENATETPYREFVQNEIWKPLNMTQTTWFPDQVQSQNRTIHYLENDSIAPVYTLNTYPDGFVHSSVKDLTKFLQEMIRGYKGEGSLLSNEAYAKMFEQSNDEIPDAVCWDMAIPCCVGHAGNDFGTATMMFFEKESGVGRILFTNKSLETDELNKQYYDVFNKLFEYQF